MKWKMSHLIIMIGRNGMFYDNTLFLVDSV
jgi:hypothetical protein